MKKKQIDWETLKYIAIVAQDNECDGCDICRQDTCPLWASLEDVVPPHTDADCHRRVFGASVVFTEEPTESSEETDGKE
jgi:hypothetical protein